MGPETPKFQHGCHLDPFLAHKSVKSKVPQIPTLLPMALNRKINC